jgi:hypothetical protein
VSDSYSARRLLDEPMPTSHPTEPSARKKASTTCVSSDFGSHNEKNPASHMVPPSRVEVRDPARSGAARILGAKTSAARRKSAARSFAEDTIISLFAFAPKTFRHAILAKGAIIFQQRGHRIILLAASAAGPPRPSGLPTASGLSARPHFALNDD